MRYLYLSDLETVQSKGVVKIATLAEMLMKWLISPCALLVHSFAEATVCLSDVDFATTRTFHRINHLALLIFRDAIINATES